jgi:hypothetical protein
VRIPGSDVSLILVPLLTRLTLGGDCDLKAKPFGRGCATELVFTVSIMLLVPRSAKRRRKEVSMQQGLAGASECLRRAWRMAQRP